MVTWTYPREQQVFCVLCRGGHKPYIGLLLFLLTTDHGAGSSQGTEALLGLRIEGSQLSWPLVGSSSKKKKKSLGLSCQAELRTQGTASWLSLAPQEAESPGQGSHKHISCSVPFPLSQPPSPNPEPLPLTCAMGCPGL